jgi:hypothetical protein
MVACVCACMRFSSNSNGFRSILSANNTRMAKWNDGPIDGQEENKVESELQVSGEGWGRFMGHTFPKLL